MKRALLIMIICLLYSKAFAQDTLVLKDAILEALENNYSIRVAEKNLEISENMNFIGNAGMLPTIDASGSAQYSENDINMEIQAGPQPQLIDQEGTINRDYSTSVQLNWTLFDGFAMFHKLDKLGIQEEMSQTELKLSVEQMLESLIQNYYEAVRLQRDLDILSASIEASRERLSRLETAADYGGATSLQLLNTQVNLNNDSSAYLQTELAYNNMIDAINFIMGRKIDQSFAVDMADIEFDEGNIGELRKKIQDNNLTILQAAQNKEISQIEADLITARYAPVITGTAQYNFSRQESTGGFMTFNEQAGYSFGLNARINLFNGLQTITQDVNADIQIRIADINVQRVKAQIDMNFMNLYRQYQNLQKQAEFERSALNSAEENYRRTEDRLELGQASSLELREARLNLNRSRSRLNAAETRLESTEARLRLLTGTLLNYEM
ncbi:MAG: TolC family protein [Candidatus Kapaibacterium sp.]